LKISNYNFFYDYEADSKVLAYNSRTGALALMENEKYDSFKQFMNNEDMNALDDQFIKDLEYGGFILNKDVNELDLVKMKLMSERYSSRHLGLTIATTINCNLGCTYCYEKDNKNAYKMSDEVHQAILDLIKNRIKNINNLHITWYGGEPLIGMDTIRYLSSEIMKLCDENDVSYQAGIITNGYLLSPKIAEELKSYRVGFAQITIDGPEHIHDKRRPLVGGQPTFNKILKNTKDVADILDSISIRINIDDSNKPELDHLLDVFDQYGLKEKVSLYLGHVHNSNDCYQSNVCLTTESYSHTSYEFDKSASQLGFNTGHLSCPTPLGSYCTADSAESFVIDPEGYVYACWIDVGNKDVAIENIVNDNFSHNSSELLQYMMYDPCEDDMCKGCKFLPVCMGGCPHSRLHEKMDRCSSYKYVMEKKLLDYADFAVANQA
jgi:uncharacterized protein